MSEPIVFVVDDDADVRKSLRWLLESVGLQAACYSTAAEFLEAAKPEQPGCIVLDVRMPGLGGLELQQMLTERRIEMPVIIITGHGEVSMAVQAMKAGAVDFLEKPFSDEQLLERVRSAIEADQVRREEAERRRRILERLELLTPRERQVMDLVVGGSSNKGAADTLGVSCKTIEAHRASVMRKMEAGNVAELVQMSLLVDPDRINV